MPNGLLLGEDARVASWAFATFGLTHMHVNRAFGIVRHDGMLVGAVLLQSYNGHNVELSYYGPHTVLPGIVRSVARAIITEFNPSRVTIVTSKRNRHLLNSVRKLGWRLEGAQRCYYGHKDSRRNTGIRYVMFREQVLKLAGFPQSVPQQGTVNA